MLEYLSISSFAVIDRLELEFHEGVTVFTGETGAGKSIIVQAIDLLRGAKGSASIIRAGEDQARIEAVFRLPGGDEMVVERTVSRSGRSRARINGQLVPLRELAERVGPLVEISSQHEQQSLLKPSYHLDVLDGFLGIRSLRNELARALDEWRSMKDRLDDLESRIREREVRRVYLEEMLSRLEDLSPREGEYEDLSQELERLSNMAEIVRECTGVEGSLYSEEGSVTERIHASIRALERISSMEPRVSEAVSMLQEAAALVEEAATSVGALVPDDLDDAESRLAAAEARLSRYESLASRLGVDGSEVHAEYERLSDELLQLEGAGNTLEDLRQELSQAWERVCELDDRLSGERRKGAPALEQAVVRHLGDLGLLQSVFTVVFEDGCSGTKTPECVRKSGSLRAVFMLAPNPGEEPRPIGEGASGGELSRLHLAMKAALSEGRSGVSPLTVYDEVDAGIGGMTAWAVGAKLAAAARHSQVVCITHLPQIAAFADHHFTVEKGVDGGRTVTRVRPVDGDARITELTRMLGTEGEGGRSAALELLDKARSLLEEQK